MEITNLTTWNPISQKVAASTTVVSLLVVITGVALMVLKSYGNVPFILYGSGGALLGFSLIYSLVLCVKGSQTSLASQANKSSAQTGLDQLTKEQVETLIFTLLTETPEEREASIKQLSELVEKTEEDKVHESFYKKFPSQSALINSLITLPNFKEHLDSLNSGMIYDVLTDYAKKLTNTNKIIQVFYLLDDAHRCALLLKSFGNKNLFLALIEKAPSSTKELLRQNEWPELLNLANELLDGWFFNGAFYHVYAALCDEDQKSCMKRFIQEPKFHSRRVEMTIKTQAALHHPIDFIDYTFGNRRAAFGFEKTNYSGKIKPSFPNETTKFFDAIVPSLPALHIVTFFWRIANTDLKVWSSDCGWTPHFQGTPEEKKFFMSLSFEQVTRLNETEQPWIAMWRPSEQPDEKIIDVCFNQLKRASEEVTEYLDTEYDPQGILFKKNWERFLFLLSFDQISMLICQDPHFIHLNQIFGFEKIDTFEKDEYLKDIPIKKYKTSLRISIPAILELWWKRSNNKLTQKKISPEERLEAIKGLNLEDKYTNYFTHRHIEHEKIRPSLEASSKEMARFFAQARADAEEFLKSKKTYVEFLFEKHQARIRAERAEQERKRLEEEQKIQNAIHLETIKNSLDVIGIDKTKEHSESEIKSFIKKELFKHHPDKHVSKEQKEIELHEARYKEICNARDDLLNAFDKMKLSKTPAF